LELVYDIFQKTNQGGNQMDEETLRKMAIEQHLQGKSPISITAWPLGCQCMNSKEVYCRFLFFWFSDFAI
jgi:hypothetical protein